MELKTFLKNNNVEEMFEELNKINNFFERKNIEMLNEFIETLKQTEIQIVDEDLNFEIIDEGISSTYTFNDDKVEIFTTFKVSENGLTVSFDTITVKLNEEVIISEMDMTEFEKISMFVETNPVMFEVNLSHEFSLNDSKNVAKRMIEFIVAVTTLTLLEIDEIKLKLKFDLKEFELKNDTGFSGGFKVLKDGEEIVNFFNVSKDKIIVSTETAQIELEPKDLDDFLKNKI